MTKKMWQLVLMLGVAVCLASLVLAGPMRTYQVTGPVLEITDTKIVVQKDADKWELARNADTKIEGELKVGAKVTIEYTMTASTVTVKTAGAAKTEKK